MKILMISSFLPFPLHSGGQVRLFNLIKELSKRHEIILVCEKRLNQTSEDIKELEKICKKVITVVRRKQWSIENVARSATSSHSFLVTGHTHPEMKKKIEGVLLQEKFDLIHVETFYVLQNLPVTPLPIVLVDHNIEYDVYKRFMNRAPLPLRPLLALDIAKIKREEEEAWRDATKVVAVSEEDKQVMQKAGIKPQIVANGVDIEQFNFKPHNPLVNQGKQVKKILFIGDFKWLQNKDSAEFIIKEIWPLIKRHSGEQAKRATPESQNVSDSGQISPKFARMTDAKLWIVARSIPDSIRNLTDDPNVLFDEESSAKSTPEIFQEADVLLAPIRIGGGTSYKILEAMSSGTPVVTMPLSARAINAGDSEQILVGKDAAELADKTIQVLTNEKLYAKVSQNGRKLIEEKYSWKEIGKELEHVYKLS